MQTWKLHVIRRRTNIRDKYINLLGPKLWNSLDKTITDLPSLHRHGIVHDCIKIIMFVDLQILLLDLFNLIPTSGFTPLLLL